MAFSLPLSLPSPSSLWPWHCWLPSWPGIQAAGYRRQRCWTPEMTDGLLWGEAAKNTPLKRHTQKYKMVIYWMVEKTNHKITCCKIKCWYKLQPRIYHRLTWGLQRFFPLRIRLSVDVTRDMVKGEKKVVLFMKLSRKLNLHLETQ